jgi:pSer/pThr/pTyr-binding forkhead associated (FHA) protein
MAERATEREMNNFQSALPARLILRSGEDLREYHLRQAEQTLGRDQTNDIVLADDEQVSGKHLRLFVRAGMYYVEDMGSTNGTFLNGERISEAVLLTSGDLIKTGKTILKYHLSGDLDPRLDDLAEQRPEQPGSDSNPEMKTKMALNLPDVRFNLGLVYFKKGEYSRAIETWERELGRVADERLVRWIEKAKACLADAGRA